MTASQAAELPRSDRWLMGGFERHYLPGFLRKHFHVVAVNSEMLSPQVIKSGSALVVFANHASWWDPMVAMFLRASLMPEHCLYAPIDASALERYKIFRRMGFYGIELGTMRGSAEFLRRSLRIVESPKASLWLTPEGRFCDVRQLDQPFLPGMAHLAQKITQTTPQTTDASRSVWFVPAAIEYCFWQERLPECLVWFGQPTEAKWNSADDRDKHQWNTELFGHLRTAQRTLAEASLERNTKPFRVILSGAAGTGKIYDWARKAVARLRGQQVSLEHNQGIWSSGI